MELFDILNSISKQLSLAERHFDFYNPFAIIFSNKNILFASSEFFNEIDNNRLNIILRDIDFTNSSNIKISNLTIFRRLIATLPNGEKLFLINIEKKSDYIEDSSYKIMQYCHDVQEPLRNISNFLQLIKIQLDQGSVSETKEYIEYAIDNISTLSVWNKELLIENYTKKPENLIYLSTIIEEIKKLLKSQLSYKNCKIILDNKIPNIKGDYLEILCVFKNLIENSLKHSKTEELLISIKLLEIKDSKIKILFTDNGKLSPENKLKIENSINNTNFKENLGLKICKNILNNNSGTIKLLNRKNCSYELILKI